jgi:hypothetical protein
MTVFGMCILSVFQLTQRFDTRFDDMATMWVEVEVLLALRQQ